MWLACQDLGSPNPRSPGRGEGWSKRNLFVVHLLRDIQLDFSEELSLRKNVVFGILKIFPSMKQPLHRYSLREAAHDLQALKQQDVHLSSARYLLWRVRVYSCGRSYCMSTVTSGWPGASASASARRSGLAGIAMRRIVVVLIVDCRWQSHRSRPWRGSAGLPKCGEEGRLRVLQGLPNRDRTPEPRLPSDT